MRLGSRLLVALAAVFLAIGPAACGDGDDSSSTTTEAALQDSSQIGKNGDGDAPDATKDGAGAGNTASGDGANGSGGSGSDDFVPRQHDDSGGGSARFRVEGGDNSVQEFGSEADDSERDAAATAVHNFLDARAHEAWASACLFLSASVRESLESLAVRAREAAVEEGKAGPTGGTKCHEVLGSLTRRAALPALRKEAAEADVRSLRIEGDRAFVIYTGLDGTVIAIPVTKEDGGWKVGSLAGTPLS